MKKQMTYEKFADDHAGRPYKLAIEISELRKKLENTRIVYFERIDSSFFFNEVSFSAEIKEIEEIIVSLKYQIHTLDREFHSYYGCFLGDLVLVD